MSFLRNFGLPLFGLALWFAVALSVLSTFAASPVVAQRAELPEIVLVAPPVVVTECCDCCDQS